MQAKAVLAAKSYPEFRSALLASACSRCGLSSTRTNIVLDRGNPSADIVVIGEAPGESEDLQGKAFVGRSGKLLDAMFAEAGIDTNRDCLILNVVKCRPPANRAPSPEEAHACLPFLQRALELVRPRYAVLLGATALKHIDPIRKKAGLTGGVGQFFETPSFPGIQFYTLFHPAYILRDPRKRPDMVSHIKGFAVHAKTART